MQPGEHPAMRVVVGFAGPALTTAGASIAVLSSFSTWVFSGRVGRSSYELFGLIDDLGITDDVLVRTLLRMWPLMPMLVVGAAVAAWWGWCRTSAVVGLLGAAYAGGVGVVVSSAVPERFLIRVTSAPTWTVCGAGLVIVGAVIVPGGRRLLGGSTSSGTVR